MSSLGPEKVCEGMDKSNSKNIAKNSIILFVRMVAITLVNLYAVRLVLRGLGDVDYGIYNALAGVVTACRLTPSFSETGLRSSSNFSAVPATTTLLHSKSG